MIKVFRIEDDCGGGMYRGFNCGKNPIVLDDGHDSSRHPLPRDDSKLWAQVYEQFYPCGWVYDAEWPDQYAFGFSSEDQLRSWVYKDSWILGMRDAGLNLSIYHLHEDHVIVGNTQCVFDVTKVLIKDRFDIAEYFDVSETVVMKVKHYFSMRM